MKALSFLFPAIFSLLISAGFVADKNQFAAKEKPRCIVIDSARMTIDGKPVLGKKFYPYGSEVIGGITADAWDDSLFFASFGKADSLSVDSFRAFPGDSASPFQIMEKFRWNARNMELSHLLPSPKNVEMLIFYFAVAEPAELCLAVDGFFISEKTTARKLNDHFKENGVITQSGTIITYRLETKTLYPQPSVGHQLYFKYDETGKRITEVTIMIMI
jgi:hypothetical protein